MPTKTVKRKTTKTKSVKKVKPIKRPSAADKREKLSIIDDVVLSAHNSKPFDAHIITSLKRIPLATLRSLREAFLACYDEGVDRAFTILDIKLTKEIQR